MTERLAAFLAGERPDDVAIFLSEAAVDDVDRIAGLDYAERVDGGVLMILDGERGRSAFQAATETDAMAFAQAATRRKGRVDRDLAGGDCPEAGDGAAEDGDGTEDDESTADDDADDGGEDDAGSEDEDHAVRFTFAFAEEQKPDMEGIYGEGDVVHAYVQCACGTRYSEQWLADEA